jgi:hypothetical protein
LALTALRTFSAALAQSKLGDAAVGKALWDGGEKAIEASQDPMILFVRKIDPEARKILTASNEDVHGRRLWLRRCA